MPKPGRTGISRIAHATKYSWQGLKAAWKNESAFRQECLLALILIPSAFYLGRNVIEWILLIATALLPIVVELLNSAIEAVVDRISEEESELAGRAKDMGSAAVMIILVITTVTWALIAYNRFVLAAP